MAMTMCVPSTRYDHILHMSDALSEGIVKQFPEKVGGAAMATTTNGALVSCP
jgi:hypothetical protein